MGEQTNLKRNLYKPLPIMGLRCKAYITTKGILQTWIKTMY